MTTSSGNVNYAGGDEPCLRLTTAFGLDDLARAEVNHTVHLIPRRDQQAPEGGPTKDEHCDGTGVGHALEEARV